MMMPQDILSLHDIIVLLFSSGCVSSLTYGSDLTRCQACGKQFKCRQNRDIHYRTIHLKVKNFKCPHCEQRFSQKSHLKGHVIRIHDSVLHDQ